MGLELDCFRQALVQGRGTRAEFNAGFVSDGSTYTFYAPQLRSSGVWTGEISSSYTYTYDYKGAHSGANKGTVEMPQFGLFWQPAAAAALSPCTTQV